MNQSDLFDSTNATQSAPQVDDRGGDVTSQCNRPNIAYSGDEFTAARKRRDEGMASALQHAEDDVPGWAAECYMLLIQFAWNRDTDFTIEQFRTWAHSNGLAVPAESRAFGPVTQRAIRNSVIVRTGYAAAASSNGSPKPTYSRTARAA